MAVVSYASSRTNDPGRNAVVAVISMVNLEKLVAEAVLSSNNQPVSIDLSLFMGTLANSPKIGEKWIITQVQGSWALVYKMSFQNSAVDVLKNSAPGDTVIGQNGSVVHILGQIDSVITEPSGVIKIWGGDTSPNGYLLCDGSSYNISDYQNLYSAIGVRFGDPGGGKFTVPNLKGRSVMGYDASQTEFNSVGKTGGYMIHIHGSAAHTHTSPAHSHTLSSAGWAQLQLALTSPFISGHRQAGYYTANFQVNTTLSTGPSTQDNTSAITLGGATDSTTPGVTGSTTPPPTAPQTSLSPYLSMNFIIKI